ncbi:hypothetical protein Patl1_22421 [Pistacia atlantica]|uniref:Uncharacterized protein n=1 Tax=Pistacia atlantica TaxID=434234 RepID=A0ACC1A2G9_9ROSI|nr:hypothetical protein Patl1_22421 [Pistacia atlantica]
MVVIFVAMIDNEQNNIWLAVAGLVLKDSLFLTTGNSMWHPFHTNLSLRLCQEGWDGTIKDLDEVHYEISQKEDEMLYRDFVERMTFNKMKCAGKVKYHRYSRRRPSEGWQFTVEKMGPRGKRGAGGGWKFVSMPDGSTRPLNETEKMFLKRETPHRRRRILP